jgi:DNA-binding CsgD family transcriptional regulator
MPASEDPQGGALYRSCAQIIGTTSAAAAIIELRGRSVVMASDSAKRLLAPAGQDVRGTRIEAYVVDPSGGLEMVANGTLSGYETRGELASADGRHRPVRTWVKALQEAHPPEHALVVMQNAEDVTPAGIAEPPDTALPTVAGVTDHRLQITHITTDVLGLLGYQPELVVGSPLFDLFVPEDIPDALWALAQAGRSDSGATVAVRGRAADGNSVPCLLVVVSLLPRPTYGFAILPSPDPLPVDASGQPAEVLFTEIAATARAADLYRRAPQVRGTAPELLSLLSTRELEIVTLLLKGDRVPAIAKALFLTQSTVRNHLSAAFRKLHVTSQQELIDKLRP